MIKAIPETKQDLFEPFGELIRLSRSQILQTVDTIQVETCWQMGRLLVECEQGRNARTMGGTRLLSTLAKNLTDEFGKGFDIANLRRMGAFFQVFPNWESVRTGLSWAHYQILLRVDNPMARKWYMNQAADQNWSELVLKSQIENHCFDQFLSNHNLIFVNPQQKSNIGTLTPRENSRDLTDLECFGNLQAEPIPELELKPFLIDHLQKFFMELDKGFAFLGRQQRLRTDSKDVEIDLVFYHHLLKCFVLLDLKPGELTLQSIGQMDLYVRRYDYLKRGPDDNSTVGILLGSHKGATVARMTVVHEQDLPRAKKFKLWFPTEDELCHELDRARARWVERSAKKNSR